MAWERMGYPVEKSPNTPIPVSDFGVNVPANSKVFIDMDEAKQYLASDDSDLVSIRSWEEFIGEKSGYNYIDIMSVVPRAFRNASRVWNSCGGYGWRDISHIASSLSSLQLHVSSKA